MNVNIGFEEFKEMAIEFHIENRLRIWIETVQIYTLTLICDIDFNKYFYITLNFLL